MAKPREKTTTPKKIAVLAEGTMTIKPETTEIIPNTIRMLKPSELIV